MFSQTRRIAVSTALLLALLTSASAALAAEPAKKPAESAKKTVNINSADVSQLAFLPRIGLSVAQRVIDFRKQNGPFKRTEDLMLVRGIGEKTFLLIKPYVSTAGETTLKEKVRTSKGEPSKPAKESDR